MEQIAKQRTRVPSHLRQFHHHTDCSKSNGPRTPQQTTCKPQTSPPRFRLSLRSALKDIISKDFHSLALHAKPDKPPMVSQPRPDPVRMKDSDDYLTERAANPRTGLISPSLVSSTPCRANTPDTPGDALKLLRHEHDHSSPTPAPKRLLYSTANEGREISSGSGLAYGEQDEQYEERRAGTPCTLPEDRLVVHMPSAKEPQPFAYPGYSSEQIEAFEHYKHKARRVSSEGYDRRFLQNHRNAPSYSATDANHEHCPEKNDVYSSCSRQVRYFQPYNGVPDRPQSQLVVRKRNVVKPVCQAGEAVAAFADQSGRAQWGAEVPDSTSTSAMTHDLKFNKCSVESHGSFMPAPSVCDLTKPAQQPHIAPEKISKQSCMAPRRGSAHQDVAKGNHVDNHNASNARSQADPTGLDMTDLRTLPCVTLVRPEYAALPGLRGQPSTCESVRSCSLGCRRDVRSGQCLEQRKVSLPVSASHLTTAELPSPNNDTGQGSVDKAEEILVGILSWSLCYIKSIQVPQSDLIETLRSSSATVREKADALKAALSLAGHVLAVGTALAMIWQLSAAVIQLLQIALWPLAVPFRILRWLLGAA